MAEATASITEPRDSTRRLRLEEFNFSVMSEHVAVLQMMESEFTSELVAVEVSRLSRPMEDTCNPRALKPLASMNEFVRNHPGKWDSSSFPAWQ